MIATFQPCFLRGTLDAPPSKSMAHRFLLGAALSGQISILTGIDYSEDILASMDCLRALGAQIITEGDRVTVDPAEFMQIQNPVLPCRESGSTLRFFLPLALCLGQPVTLTGSRRLLERPLGIYEDLCREKGFSFCREETAVTVCGNLESGHYTLRGNVSSQFITGLIFALVYRNRAASIQILPPVESRSYIHMTLSALQAFGADVAFTEENTITVRKAQLHGVNRHIEGDYSNAAFLEAFNQLGSAVEIRNLDPNSLQGDQVYKTCFRQLAEGMPTIDISDCPDLGPVLFALAAMKNGAIFTGTDRLKAKESDRGMAMHRELEKLGGGLVFGDNTVTVPRQDLQYKGVPLQGHNDHRIVMALSVLLSRLGGSIHGAEAVKKSYPGFFRDIRSLGTAVTLEDAHRTKTAPEKR